MFLFHFYFALRIGELTDSRHNILIDQVRINKNSISLEFVSYKHSNSEHNDPHIVFGKLDGHCPVQSLLLFEVEGR